MIVGYPHSFEMPLPKEGTGTAPFDFSILTPERPLPDGITFNPRTRMIEGTPAAGSEQEEASYIYQIIDAARPNRITQKVFKIAVAADTNPTLVPITDKEFSLGEESTFVLPSAMQGNEPYVYELLPGNSGVVIPDWLVAESPSEGVWRLRGTPTSVNAGVPLIWKVTDADEDEVEQPFNIKVTAIVNPPSNTVASPDRVNVALRWTIPTEGGEHIAGYLIRYRLKGTTAWTEKTINQYQSTFGLIDNTLFSTGSTYEWQVKSRSRTQGYSDSDYVTGPDFVPLASARTPLATPVPVVGTTTSSTIAVSWPAIANANAYVVSWSQLQGSDTGSRRIRGNAFTITGLVASATYRITVTAQPSNSLYERSAEGVVSGSTSAVPTLAAPAPTVHARATTSITIRWNVVEDATGYTVSVVGASGVSVSQSSPATGIRQAVVSGLTEGTSYTIEVVATASGYQSSAAGSVTATTESSTPTPTPTKLATPAPGKTAETQTTITIRWSVIEDATGYIVRYRKPTETGGSTSNVVQSSPATGLRQAVISNLDANTSYVIEVIATASGFTNSDAGSVTASTNVPPTITISGPSSVVGGNTVSFNATAADADGSIASYQWSVDGGTIVTGATTATLRWTAPDATSAAQAITVRCTVTDNDGATRSALYAVTVPSEITVALAVPGIPATPTTGIDDDSAVANWLASTPSAGVGSYSIQIKRGAQGSVSTLAALSTAMTRTLSSLQASAEYFWRVRANPANSGYSASAWSAWQSFTTLDPRLPVPGSRTATRIDHDSARLGWAASTPAASILSYTVRYREVGGSTWTSRTTTQLYYDATSLSSETQYEWEVRANARSGYRASLFSNDLTNDRFTTGVAPPPAPTPIGTPSPTVHATTENSITIRWNVIQRATGYTVSVVGASGVSVSQSSPSTGIRQAVLTGLTADTQYTIQVIATTTAAGFADSGAGRVTGRTDEAEIPTVRITTQPTTVNGGESVRIAATGTGTGITYNWSTSQGGGSISGSSSQVVWTAPTPGRRPTTHTISVTVTNQFGTTTAAATLQIKVRGKPAPPTSLSETQGTSPTRYTLGWSHPADRTGIRGYRVEWRRSSETLYSGADVSATSLSYSLRNLTISTAYVWRIKAVGGGDYQDSDWVSGSFNTDIG